MSRPVSDRRSLQKRGSGRFRRLSGGSGSIQLQLQRRRREVSGRESFTVVVFTLLSAVGV